MVYSNSQNKGDLSVMAYRATQLFILLAVFCFIVPNVRAAANKYPQKCLVDYNQMLNLSPREFDQNWEKGWVKLADIDGCKEAAANLIALYYSQRDLPDGAMRILKFHEAQLRAELEQYDFALLLFPQTKQDETGTVWNYYVDGTMAFLAKDKARLEQSIKRLSAVPKPESFNPVDAEGNPMDVSWPPNLDVLERFKRCFDESYLEAYAGCEEN